MARSIASSRPTAEALEENRKIAASLVPVRLTVVRGNQNVPTGTTVIEHMSPERAEAFTAKH